MNDFNYELLETARQLRRLTQKEVASKVGISQASLSKAEHGMQELPYDTMVELSQFYDFPIDFFYRDNSITPAGHLFYRKKLTISEKIIDSFVAKIQIIKAIVDELMTSVELPEYTLNSYDPIEYSPKEIADRIRNELNIARGPIPNLIKLLEDNGVIIIRIDFGTDKIDGLTTITASNRKVMFINNQMPNDRIRFSVAHELGHLVMHLSKTPQSVDSVEDEADSFASQFLLPESEVSPFLKNMNLSILAQLKRRWRVSMRALIRRAKDLGIISKEEYRKYQIIFSKKGYNKNEPILLPIEQPTLFTETIELYKNELGYSDSDLMQIMRICQKDYTSWFEEKPYIIQLNNSHRIVTNEANSPISADKS